MILINDLKINQRIQVKQLELKENSYGIVGPNGAGKSSLLKAIANLITYDGSIVVDSDISFCGEASSLEGDMVVSDILFYARGNKAQDSSFLNQLVSHFMLETLLSRPLSKLSGGEKQRVNLVCAFYLDCEYTFLDEPTNYLDPIYVDKLSEYIKDWKKKVFIVSHDLNFICENVKNLITVIDGRADYCASLKRAIDDQVFDKVFKKSFRYEQLNGRQYIL